MPNYPADVAALVEQAKNMPELTDEEFQALIEIADLIADHDGLFAKVKASGYRCDDLTKPLPREAANDPTHEEK